MGDDTQLFLALKTGDKTAVRTWYSTYQPKLLRFVLAKITQETDAEEVTQDTFVSCLRHLPLFRGESSIWTWMVRVAQHEIADYYRKKYAKKIINAIPLSDLFFIEHLGDAHDVSEKVRAILMQMTRESREILEMKYIDKKHVKQIAREMGRTVKSVESVLFRARIEFKSLYADRET